MRTRFVLFDIDGTLLKVQKMFMQELITEVLKRSGREQAVIAERPFAGRTDRDIFASILADNDLPVDQFNFFRDIYLEALEQMLKPDDLEELPGAREAIEFALDSGHMAGLLTGNFREAAFTKLNRADLDRYFSMGAFGGDHAERSKLPEVAYELGKMLIGSSFEPTDMVIIGDTPNDIDCAKRFGCVSVSVSTGPFSQKQLDEHEPDLNLSHLGEPERWLSPLLKV